MDEKAARRQKLLEDLEYATSWPLEFLHEPVDPGEYRQKWQGEVNRRSQERFGDDLDEDVAELIRARIRKNQKVQPPSERKQMFDEFGGPELPYVREPAAAPALSSGTGDGVVDRISSVLEAEKLRLQKWLQDQKK
jgi:hypothetical protein